MSQKSKERITQLLSGCLICEYPVGILNTKSLIIV